MIFNSSEDSFDSDSIFSASPFPQNASDYSTALNTKNYFEASSVSPVIDDAIIDTQPQNETSFNPPFNLGFYTVGDTGKVNFDYLLNGGAYQGELGIFSLAGLGKYEIGTEAFIEETARRSLSNSPLGHVVISEQTEAARYTTEDADYTTGKYEGIKTFEMNPGEQFGVMLIPDGTVEEVLENPGIGGSKQPIYSIAPMNPQKAFHIGQLKDMNNGGIWVMEDLSADSATDKDFNDFVFYMEGAVGNAPSFETLVNPVHDWRSQGVGKNLLTDESIGVLPKPSPDPAEEPKPEPIINNNDLVKGTDEKVYLIQEDKKRLIPNPGILQGNGFKTDAIKTLPEQEFNSIPLGDNVTIPSQYQESVDVTNNWTSDLYWWDGNGKPSIDFSDNSNNKFATLNLGSNTRNDGKKGISFDWGDGSPKADNKLLNDNFVVRSYTQANLEKGKKYKAIVTADDGYQLFAKNQNTDKWVYFTSQDEWEEAYGGEEITLEVDETGLYDFHFHYFEKDGDAEFDLSWEEVPLFAGEPPKPPVDPIIIPLPPVELSSLTDNEWDEYSSDDTKFDGEGNDESPDSIKDIYKELSNAIFGKDVPMSAGYAYDVSYENEIVIENQTGWSHSGIDFDSNTSDEVKAIVNGKIAKIEDKFVEEQLGYAIGVNELDKNGEEVGRIWWYFHLDSPGDWQIGDPVKAGISNFGIVHPEQGHLHLTVQNDKLDEEGYINSLDSDVVISRTMSPLQAFWLSENKTYEEPEDPNGELSKAVDLGSLNDNTQTIFDSIGYNSDLNDFFKLNLSTTSNINLSLNSSNINEDNVAFELLKINGDSISSSNPISTSADSLIRILESGDYYIRVYTNSTNVGSDYELKLTQVNLSGKVRPESQDINIWRYDTNGRTVSEDGREQGQLLTYEGIEPGKETVVVIHGWQNNDTTDNISRLSKKVSEDAQVVALDWGSIGQAGLDDLIPVPYNTAEWIAPVSRWFHQRLKKLGINPNQLTLIGHSLGAYVASETAHQFGKVKHFVGLDPAFPADGNLGYDVDREAQNKQNPNNFIDIADKSLSFVVGDNSSSEQLFEGAYGDNDKASTAHDSFLVQFDFGDLDNVNRRDKAHGAVVDTFTDALSKEFINLANLNLPNHEDNWYANDGGRDTFFERISNPGKHEGVIYAKWESNSKDENYWDITELKRVVDSSGKEESTWNWNETIKIA